MKIISKIGAMNLHAIIEVDSYEEFDELPHQLVLNASLIYYKVGDYYWVFKNHWDASECFYNEVAFQISMDRAKERIEKYSKKDRIIY